MANISTDFDVFGNKHVTTATGLAATPSGLVAQSRPTTASYDTRGQFATSIANALGESETWTYNGDYGTPATHTGPNGVPTTWSYDSFGRVTLVVNGDGTATVYSYAYCTSGCPANAAYYVQAQPVGPDGQGNGATTIAYYDSLSRVIATDTASFDTSASHWIRSETRYDGFGRVAQASRPYFLGVDAPVYAVSSFLLVTGDTDPLARPHGVTAADGSVTSFTYDGLVTSVTNARGATTTTTKNAQGLTAQVTDANGQATTYSYDASGDMTTANPPGPAITHFTYDLRGRKITANDMDFAMRLDNAANLSSLDAQRLI